MNNIIINRAESIFEPFWDSGESYPTHRKFSRLSNYTVTLGKGAQAAAKTDWASVVLTVEKPSLENFDIKIERKCSLDIKNYDTFILFGKADKNSVITVNCTVDGKNTEIISTHGANSVIKHTGKISGKTISQISISLKSEIPDRATSAALYWLGLGKSDVIAEEKSVYSPDWEGCFNDSFDIKPSCNIFFDENELMLLRKKLTKEPFKSIYKKIYSLALQFMDTEPEKKIGRFFPCANNQFGVESDTDFISAMELLAFCGIIENNPEMLKMACRFALSAAHCEYWCEHVMGVFPGATWHHRSFTEYKVCHAAALVLDWAGTLLTWHGKNIVYDAIIMKGLPRIEADFKTMDYIYECNQGFMFNRGRVAALLALIERYPRYKSDLAESENFMNEMIEKSIGSDGGTLEGPSYWAAVIQCVSPTLFMLARYKKVPLCEYTPQKLHKAFDYGLAVRSDWGKHMRFIPISDTPAGSENFTHANALTFAFAAIFSNNPTWQEIYNRDPNPFLDYSFIEYLVMAPELKPLDHDFSLDGFLSLNKTGITTVRKNLPDLGAVHFTVLGGEICFSHNHEDKGSFILEVNGQPIFIDGGTCGYGDPQSDFLHSAAAHNLFLPQLPNGVYIKQKSENHTGAVVLESSYKNGNFKYSTDILGAWDSNVITKSIRSVTSNDIRTFIIEDILESTTPLSAHFLLNTYAHFEQSGNSFTVAADNVLITVTPLNYTPKALIHNIGYGSSQNDDMSFKSLEQLRLSVDESKSHHIKTRITISALPE